MLSDIYQTLLLGRNLFSSTVIAWFASINVYLFNSLLNEGDNSLVCQVILMINVLKND